MAKKQQKPQKSREKKARIIEISDHAYTAKVVELIGSIGTKQGGTQVRCKVLQGPDTGKIIRRNVLGPVKINDLLMLKETEIEANPLKGRKR